MNTTVFTLCNIKYLPQAIVAMRTFSQNNNVTNKVVIVADLKDKILFDDIELVPIMDIIKWGLDYGIEIDLEIIKNYTITSICTSIKPLALIYNKIYYGNKLNIYIDPDTMWMGELHIRFADNYLNFPRHRDILFDNKNFSGKNFLIYGGCNLGLIVDTGAEIQLLIDWFRFAEKINFESSIMGYYTDQKPADMMVLSEKAKVFYDSAINLSYWNISDHRIKLINDNVYIKQNNDQWVKLVMYHFSGYKKNIKYYDIGRYKIYNSHPDEKVLEYMHKIYDSLINKVRESLNHYEINSNELMAGQEIYKIYEIMLKRVNKKNNLTRLLFLLISSKILSKYLYKLMAKIYNIRNPLKI